MEQNVKRQVESTPEADASRALADAEAETLDLPLGADVVMAAYDPSRGLVCDFKEVPAALRQRVSRDAVLAANPHEGVALFCTACDLMLNGARTAGVCPICGARDADRIRYFIADTDDDPQHH